MRRSLVAIAVAVLGAAAITITSVVVYQHVTAVQEERILPPAAAEYLETDDAKPAGRFLPMPKTGRE